MTVKWGVTMIFANRCEAGRRLVAVLERFRDSDALVLALPRGGVPVAFEVAHGLALPLDVLVVKKLGAPMQPELAIGAVTSDVVVLDDEIIALLGVPEWYVETAVQQARSDAKDRAQRFRGDRPPLRVGERPVILVDDGIATGSTMLAAISAVRRLEADRVIVAIPVAPPQSLDKVRQRADEVVCLETPTDFSAVGVYYQDFRQMTDLDVSRILKRSRLEREAHYHPATAAK